MISEALLFLSKELNTYLKTRFTLDEDAVVLSSLTLNTGEGQMQIQNKLCLTLINIKEETATAKSVNSDDAVVHAMNADVLTDINLVVLLSANFALYPMGLKLIAAGKDYFHGNSIFKAAKYQALNPVIDTLMVKPDNISYQDLSYIWAMQGGKYLPSIIYKVKISPNAIVQVETAIPVFIGYTEKALYAGENLLMKPTQVDSMSDYINYFGKGPDFKLGISPLPPLITQEAGDFILPALTADFSVTDRGVESQYFFTYENNSNYNLFKSLQLFYQHGGEKCFIISVGSYAKAPCFEDLDNGLKKVEAEDKITLICMPDSLLLTMAEHNTLNSNILGACQNNQRTFALLDIYGGERFKDAAYLSQYPATNIIDCFRANTLGSTPEHGAAYFPWLQTAIFSASDLGLGNFNLSALTSGALTSVVLKSETTTSGALTSGAITPVVLTSGVLPSGVLPSGASTIDQDQFYQLIEPDLKKLLPASFLTDSTPDLTNAHSILMAGSLTYALINEKALEFINIISPAPAMAGVYTTVDKNKGVWIAPANVSLYESVKPLYNFQDAALIADFNLEINPAASKPVNLIRSFQGEGTLVWGAHTLNGNSQDFQYVNVRRTMTMIEQSVKLAAESYVFEANDANTWVSLTSILESFLCSLWKLGALVGALAPDSYNVSVGLNKTMTGDDILNGIMRITVLVAITKPAEFIEITFVQQMQQS